MSVSLPALLQHPDLPGLEVLAGDPGVVWSEVYLEVREADLPAVTPASLVILPVVDLQGQWQLDALLRRLHTRGSTGLALPAALPVDEATRRLAVQLGITLLHSPRPSVLARVCWLLLGGSDALTLFLVGRISRSIERAARDLDDLLAHLSSETGLGVCLVDAGGVVAQAGDPCPPEALEQLHFGAGRDLIDVGGTAVAAVAVDERGRQGLRLCLVARGLDRDQLRALGAAALVAMPAVAARLLIDRVDEISDAARTSSLLDEFLERANALDGDLDKRLAEHRWRVEGWHLGFRFVSRRVEPLELLRSLRAPRDALPVDSHAVVWGDGVSGWLTFRAAPSAQELRTSSDALRRLHERLAGLYDVATGIGTLQRGAVGLAQTIQESSDAARLAQKRSGGRRFLHVDRLGLDQLLLAWTDNDAFLPAATALLGSLRREDQATLAAYLDHESSLRETADELGIHRNTVAQRLARIETQLGLDLTDPDTRLALHLACRAVIRTASDRSPRG